MSETSSAKINSEDSTATPPLAVSRLRVRNFKAIRDSGTVHFSPLTAFIGNNGVGKSSLVEALEMLHDITKIGLSDAMGRWRGFNYIRNQVAPRHIRTNSRGREYQNPPISFRIAGSTKSELRFDYQKPDYDYYSAITAQDDGRNIAFLQEYLVLTTENQAKFTASRHRDGTLWQNDLEITASILSTLFDRESLFSMEDSIAKWQIVRFQPERMMAPHPISEVGGAIMLATDGSNIAEYLLDIRNRDEGVFDGIVETLQMVLPYAVDIQSALTSEVGRNGYLRLRERGLADPLPSWLLSTGTLRVVALLALLRHPEPPPLIVIEEIENGLDPRTIHLLVEEMRYAVENGITQIILTTHSPYLLDLLSLSQIVVVERDATGEPKFFRPGDDAALDKWSAQFTPGQLYTMGRLGRGGK